MKLGNLKDKFVVRETRGLMPRYHKLSHRVFLVQSGFGCSPNATGNALIGMYVDTGEHTRIERWQVERLATEQEVLEAIKLNPKGRHYGSPLKTEYPPYKWSNFDIPSMTVESIPRLMAIIFHKGETKTYGKDLAVITLNISPHMDDTMWYDITKIFEQYKKAEENWNYSEALDLICKYFKENDYWVENRQEEYDFDEP